MLSGRVVIVGLLVVVAVAGAWLLELVDLRLAAGLLLLAMAAAFYSELVQADGWATGGATTYGVAVVSLVIELTLPFISWYDLWLTSFCGFGATLSAVTAACMPYLDRRQVPDMMDEIPDGSDDSALAIPAKALSPLSQNRLLLFSQLVMAGNFLIVWAIIHRHAGQ